MAKTALITGGAGFIGSHLTDALLAGGYHVRILDKLVPQVHDHNRGPRDAVTGQRWPAYLASDVEGIVGDVCDPETVARALDGVNYVVHLAAAVGVGQSMYAIRDYNHTNAIGTATLLEALIDQPVERLVVASSMSIYGEGLYLDSQGQARVDAQRTADQLHRRQWEPRDHHDQPMDAMPTPEDKPPQLASIYAVNKFDQERSCLAVGQAYDIPTVALRFFNAYGPRQALSNPYTGVLAIFAARLLNGKPPLVFEDGGQRRDFVHVTDVARACQLALEQPEIEHEVFNVGSGQHHAVQQVARILRDLMGLVNTDPSITGQYRAGDIRHCFADISKAQRMLGYRPQVALEDGLAELADDLKGQHVEDHAETARHELAKRGLTV